MAGNGKPWNLTPEKQQLARSFYGPLKPFTLPNSSESSRGLASGSVRTRLQPPARVGNTGGASISALTESAKAAEAARQARLQNARNAGAASSSGADAAEELRKSTPASNRLTEAEKAAAAAAQARRENLNSITKKGGRRTHKSKGRKNNRKSRRQQ